MTLCEAARRIRSHSWRQNSRPQRGLRYMGKKTSTAGGVALLVVTNPADARTVFTI